MVIKESNSNNFDNMKCIWMASNIISYKLCDCAFNCEGCLFDKAMRNMLTESDFAKSRNLQYEYSENLLDEKINSIEQLCFNDKTVYLSNGLALGRIGDNTYYLGFNPILMYLLEGELKSKLSEDYKEVSDGDDFFELTGEWGSIQLNAPFNLIMVDKLSVFQNISSSAGWFAIITVQKTIVDENEISLNTLEEQKRKVLLSLKSFKEKYSLIGGTMYDGGQKIGSLYKIIGADEYKKLINNFIQTKK